jgi:hypothetical protein
MSTHLHLKFLAGPDDEVSILIVEEFIESGGSRMNIAPASHANLAAAAQVGTTLTQSTVVKSSTVQSAEISISTAEGDTVTLAANVRLDGTFASYEQLSRGAGSATLGQAEAQNVDFSRQFSISVTGNLSHRELQDIRRALHYIDKAAKELLAGDANGAQKKLEDLGKLKTLSSIGADIRMQNNVSVESRASLSSSA